MSQHEQLEAMCALAVSGQIDEAEREELNRHLANCAECRGRVADFAQISAQALPLQAESYQRSHSTRELTFRFVLRARAEGIPLSEVKPSFATRGNWLRPAAWGTVFAAALVVLMVIAGSTAYLQLRPRSGTRASSQVSSPRKPDPLAPPKPYTKATRPRASVRTTNSPADAESAPVVGKLEMVETSVHYQSSPDVLFGLKRPASTLSNLKPDTVQELYVSNHLPDRLEFTVVSSADRIHGWALGGILGGPVVRTASGTNVVSGLLRPSGGYFRNNETFQYFNQGNAVQAWTAARYLFDRDSSYAFRVSVDAVLEQRVDLPAMLQKPDLRLEIDWHKRWLKRMEQIFPTPNRSSLSASDLASSFDAWNGIDKEKLTTEIDWHQRLASTSSERLLALRNSSQCASDPALRLNAWAGIPKPNANLEIDWHQHWLTRDSEKPLNAASPSACALAERTLQSKVRP